MIKSRDGAFASAPSPAPRFRDSFRLVVRAVQVRLRFVAVFAVSFLVVGKWDAIRNHWERLTRAVVGSTTSPSSVSNDTEFFCPMDPGVLSDWPGKCGICNMGLVRRKRGEAVPLPSGVVARMQISPYRIQLAGIQTSPVVYRPLVREAVLLGVVADGETVVAEATDRDISWLNQVQHAEIVCESLPGQTFTARIRVVQGERAILLFEPKEESLRTGMHVSARLRRPLADFEPFRSQPADPPVLRKGEPRAVYLCPAHPEVIREAAGQCPVDGKVTLESLPLHDNQRVGWWCPMHPDIKADRAGTVCAECGGMKLVPRVITYRPVGQVLTVPESAVVDTGLRTVVYVETMPGMFDGIEVVLGPRCGDSYPVVRGLEPGMRVATAGTFLIDAETRLNPALASAYFGAARKPTSDSKEGSKIVSESEIPPELKSLIVAQRICPVTGKPLGSMGIPLKVDVAGRIVLICCEGCERPLLKSPEKYLARLNDSKTAVSRP